MGSAASTPDPVDDWSPKTDNSESAEPTLQLPPMDSVQDMVAVAKHVQDGAVLAAVTQYAAEQSAELFHYAAAVGDREFFSIMMAFLPTSAFAWEMRRRNANGRRPIDSCEHMHPPLASALKTFFIQNGVDLNTKMKVMAAAKSRVGRSVKLEEVVGLEKPRERIQQAIRLSETTPDVPIKPLLLEGPPGTGKSFFAKCIAAELDREVVEIKTHDVLCYRLGGTETQVRAYFERAARAKPRRGLVVINEFESLCPRPKESSESWHSTLRQCFLTLFDDTMDPTSSFWGVPVILTTNLVDNVDRAALSRVERIHIPLPGASDIKLLFPKLSQERVPLLNTERVDWDAVASVAHELLSVRGVQDAIAAVARRLLETGAAASTGDFEAAVYEVLGDVPPEPLKRADRFIRVEIPPTLVKSASLASCLARCGWRFSSAPAAVFRQVFALRDVDSSTPFILREVQSQQVFAGRGCYRALTNPRADQTQWKPFDKYEAFVQCTPSDADACVPEETTSVFLESSGNVGAQRLEWTKTAPHLAVYARGAWSATVAACLAPRMKLFAQARVFVESQAVSALNDVAPESVLVLRTDDASYLVGQDAALVVGKATPAALARLGYQVFVAATASTQLVPPHAAVAYLSRPDAPEDEDLKRMVVGQKKFVVCPNTATTIGATLRANSIFYAALDAVYVRQTQFEAADIESLRGHGHQLLAVPVDGPTSAWSGPSIADCARESSFRALFDVYTPCTSPHQVLALGATVMVDVERLSQPLSAGKRFAILRCYPSTRMTSQEQTTHLGAAISESGARVRDTGYSDDDFLLGFRKGWYEDVYWRTVGNHPSQFLAGGVDGNDYKFKIEARHGFGLDNRRIMVKLPVDGLVFCRGMNGNASNPTMACVLFDANGNVRDAQGYKSLLGRWNDIVQ